MVHISSTDNSTLLWVQDSTSFSALVTLALTSTMDSFGILLEYVTIPLLVFSSTKRPAWTVVVYCLSIIKHIFPLALEFWTLALIITVWPTSERSISLTFVNFLVNLSSGSPCDLFKGRSPNWWALGSFGSFLNSSFAAAYACLAANLASLAACLAFLPPASLPSFFPSFLSFFPSFGAASALPFGAAAAELAPGAPHDYLTLS